MPKRRTVERKHRVIADFKVHDLTKAGTSLSLDVFSDDEKLGSLVVGRGSFTWTGSNRKRSARWDWTSFAKMMNQMAYGE